MTSEVEAAPKSPFGWFNLASDGGVPLRALTEDPPIPAMFRPLWDGYTQQDTSAVPEAAGAYIRELVTLAQNLTTSSDAFAASRGMCILSAPSPGTRLVRSPAYFNLVDGWWFMWFMCCCWFGVCWMTACADVGHDETAVQNGLHARG